MLVTTKKNQHGMSGRGTQLEEVARRQDRHPVALAFMLSTFIRVCFFHHFSSYLWLTLTRRFSVALMPTVYDSICGVNLKIGKDTLLYCLGCTLNCGSCWRQHWTNALGVVVFGASLR
uniref:Uncharacterized protein n=1 Tax=Odontella aurita TaxID=265563 RepID=A0A7S4NB73_9STRA